MSSESTNAPTPSSSRPLPGKLPGPWQRTRAAWRTLAGEERHLATVSRDLARWAIIAIPIGLIAGVGSIAFFFTWQQSTELFLVRIVGITYPYAGAPPTGTVVWASSFPRILLLPAVMVAGGLGAGAIAQFLAPEVAGHGTDDAIEAFHRKEGKIRRRVPFLKLFASALTLGTGGAGGREGPTAQIGAGFGSWWADLLHLSAKERRIALVTGLGAGVGAIFKAPLGGALYSAEIMYIGDFEPEVFVPAIIGSVVSYSVYSLYAGTSTLFASPASLSSSPWQLPLYALLGLACAAAGILFVWMYRGTENRFRRLSWPLSLKVGAGAGASAGIVLVVYFLLPQSNHFAALASVDVGYGFVQAAMLGQIGAASLVPLLIVVLAVAVVVRMLTTSFTVGSGGAAGLFGSSVVVGALLGSTLGGAFHIWLPGIVSTSAVAGFAIVGMMSFFGGISKAPLAVLVMVVEMSGSYALLLPAMLAIFIAYAATGKWHIYRAQVANRLSSPAHREEFRNWLLEGTPARALARPVPPTILPSSTVADAEVLALQGEPPVLLVGAEGHWQGVLRVPDIPKVPSELRGKTLVADLVRPLPPILPESENALGALRAMNTSRSEIALLRSSAPPGGLVGLVERSAVMRLLASGEGEVLEVPASSASTPLH